MTSPKNAFNDKADAARKPALPLHDICPCYRPKAPGL